MENVDKSLNKGVREVLLFIVPLAGLLMAARGTPAAGGGVDHALGSSWLSATYCGHDQIM